MSQLFMKFSFHLIRYPLDNARVFQRVSMNLNMTVVHCEKCFYNFWKSVCHDTSNTEIVQCSANQQSSNES